MKNKEYWQKRAEEIILMAELSVLDVQEDLMSAYNVALASIKKEIDAFFGKYGRNQKILYPDILKKLTPAELKDFRVVLKEWIDKSKQAEYSGKYNSQLASLSKRVYLTRLESLEANIFHHIEELKVTQHSMMDELMANNYLAGYYMNQFNNIKGLEIGVRFDTIDNNGVIKAVTQNWNGANYSARIWADKDALIKTLKTVIPQSFSRGFNSNKLGDMIAKELNVSKKRARALARTEVNYICNQSTIDTYAVLNVTKYEYLATLDMRTSDICRDMDGFIGDVAKASPGVNYPPMHVNCRSTTIPYIEDIEEGSRIARDENGKNILVPESMTQEEWIKTYVPESQQSKLLKFVGKYRPKN